MNQWKRNVPFEKGCKITTKNGIKCYICVKNDRKINLFSILTHNIEKINVSLRHIYDQKEKIY